MIFRPGTPARVICIGAYTSPSAVPCFFPLSRYAASRFVLYMPSASPASAGGKRRCVRVPQLVSFLLLLMHVISLSEGVGSGITARCA